MKKIIYVGNFSFPKGNAAGNRVFGIGKILETIGYEVIFIGMENDDNLVGPLIKSGKIHENMKYYNYSYPQKTIEWINYNHRFEQFKELITDLEILNDIEFIIYYDSPSISAFISKLIRYSRKNNIKIIADVVDWLTPKTNNRLFDMSKSIDNWSLKSKINLKADGVITISQYLKDYYSTRGSKVTVIPPVMTENLDKKDIDKELFISNSQKVILYAGKPFRIGQKNIDEIALKDRIDLIFSYLLEAKKKKYNFIFKVYGFEKKDFLNALPNYESVIVELGNTVEFFGRLPNEIIKNEIIKADYTILFRDYNRASNAGFPTKVSESISYGTPVITNDTSDLKDYIINGKNGYIIDSFNYASIDKIFGSSKEKVWDMKCYCAYSNVFSYKNYIENLELFLKTV